jgi:hypothetical protein
VDRGETRDTESDAVVPQWQLMFVSNCRAEKCYIIRDPIKCVFKCTCFSTKGQCLSMDMKKKNTFFFSAFYTWIGAVGLLAT